MYEDGTPVLKPDGSPWGYRVEGAFDVRRFAYDDGGLTQVTIRVALQPGADVSPPALAGLKNDVLAGVDAHYNNGQIMPNGDRLNVSIEFVAPDADPHLTVDVSMKSDASRADQTHWFAGDDPTVHAHELGHQLGLLDEYIDPRGHQPGDARRPRCP